MVASCQIHWEKATNWTIYRYQGHRAFQITVDSLKNYERIELDQDSMSAFVDSAHLLHPNGPVAWMGGYIATCDLDGVVRKVDLSKYGGFFFDEKTGAYYELPFSKSEQWISFLHEHYLSLTRRLSPQR